ncbi:uridine kinase [Alkaliphilus sp. B6464]|nr:uridine kinase [Alkaliphilus sp. B6464]
MVAIDGLGGSGKTTITKSIAENLKTKGYNPVIIHIDDFIQPKSVRYNEKYEEWFCYYHLQWRYKYLIDNILCPIYDGEKMIDRKIELYDKDIDEYKVKDFKYDSDKSLLIIEGVFLQRPELKKFLNYVIYLDIPKDIRLERVIKRDRYIGNDQQIVDKYKTRYFPAEERYISTCCPKDNADLVISYI